MRAVFLLLALVAAASGLQLAAAPRPAAAVATRRAAPLMAMPTIDDAKNLSDDELNQEIVNAQKVRCDRLAGASPPRRPRFAPGVARAPPRRRRRLPRSSSSPPAPRLPAFSRPLPLAAQELFELRKKVKTRQDVKSHLFVHTKHRIAQLQSLLTQRQL